MISKVSGDYEYGKNRYENIFVYWLRLGYKSGREYGISFEDEDQRCEMHFEEEKHTPEHYIQCLE